MVDVDDKEKLVSPSQCFYNGIAPFFFQKSQFFAIAFNQKG